MTHGNAATNGFLNSQTDSIFNSKHNLQLSEVDSNIGMSFGRATEDGLHVKSLNKLAATNMPSLSMNRQLKSDRNVFNAQSAQNGFKGKQNSRLSPLTEHESEFINMGELA